MMNIETKVYCQKLDMLTGDTLLASGGGVPGKAGTLPETGR